MIDEVLSALSDRLETLEARVIADAVSHGYEDERYNGRPLIALDVRPEFRALIDVATDPFEQELPLLRNLENATDEAFCWDETEFADLGADHTEGVYLIDVNALDRILAAVQQIPAVTAAQRADALEQYRIA